MRREDMGRLAQAFGLRVGDYVTPAGAAPGAVSAMCCTVYRSDGSPIFSCVSDERLGEWLADYIIKTVAPLSVEASEVRETEAATAPSNVLGIDRHGRRVRKGDRVRDVETGCELIADEWSDKNGFIGTDRGAGVRCCATRHAELLGSTTEPPDARPILGRDCAGNPIRKGDRVRDTQTGFEMTVDRGTSPPGVFITNEPAGSFVPQNRAMWIPNKDDVATVVARALDDDGAFEPLEPAT